MAGVIVVFPKADDVKSIRNLLIRNGYEVSAACTSGAQALSAADRLGAGVIVCGYKYPDMMYEELYENLSPSFAMLLIASARAIGEGVAEERRKKKRRAMPPQRSDQDRKDILEAKQLLMERNHMTEEEAHRYLQKTSMDSGTNLVETAQMLLTLMDR